MKNEIKKADKNSISEKVYNDLNSLIEIGKEPVKDMEYIVMREYPHYIPRTSPSEGIHDFRLHDEIIIQEGTIVNNVRVKKENGRHLGYNFTIKETGLESHTNYPWILAENTPENVVKIAQLKESEKEIERLESILSSLRSKINTLKFYE